jgi:capsular exopolysaccharide synthesis family protein
MLAANLAGCLARAECKTLLVDTNIYKPTLHKYFGLDNEKGIFNLLDSEVTAKEIIHKTRFERLSVVTSGSWMKQNNGLIYGGKQIKKFLDELSEQYDFLILDSPACLELVDCMMLATLVDCVLVVVRLGMTHSSSVEAIIQQFEHVHANVSGIVVNGVENMYSKDYLYDEPKRKNVFKLNVLKVKLLKKRME